MQIVIKYKIVTNSSRETFKIKSLNNQNLIQMFNIIVCGDDSGNLSGKPSPDLYLIAWEKFNQPPTEHCLVFEDSINGVKAALNANMNVGFINTRWIIVKDITNSDININTGCLGIQIKLYQPI